MRTLLSFAIVIACAFATCAAHADDRDVLPPAPSSTAPVPPRPWLFVDGGAPGTAVAYTNPTYTAASRRAFDMSLAYPGAVVEAGAEGALLSWLSVSASGFGAGDGSVGGRGGLRVSLLPKEGPTRLSVMLGGSRELSGDPGAFSSITFEQIFGRARATAMVNGSHVFAPGRDSVDLMAAAGASYGIVGPLRGGVEWVGQDLESAVDDDEAEGGMRHFAGPTAAFELLGGRLTFVVGPAFGLTPRSPPFLGRLQAGYAF